jgi:iron complex outermembrane receptor protein
LLATPQIYAAEAGSGFTLEEITVTARKREESLQDAPVSISAFTENELKVRQISSTDQLADVTPNLTFDAFAPSSGSNSSSMIYIRGIGQLDFSAVTDPGVGLYVDGVYYSRSLGGALNFLDLERIEVLRGPQGTLFGRNTIGGAVILHSKRPAEEFGGSLEVEVGTENMVNVTANVDIPISEKLLTKWSVASRQRDGYVKPVNRGGADLGDDDTLAGRFAVLWTPTDSLEVLINGDYISERENGTPNVSLGVNDQQTFAYFTNIFQAGCLAPPPTQPPGPGRDTMNDPNCANDTAFIGEHKSGATYKETSELDYWGLAVTASWQVNDGLKIKSITAYRDLDMFSQADADHTEWLIFHRQDWYEHDQFSQELQFSGGNDRMNWILGLYYFEEDADNLNPVRFPAQIGSLDSGGKTDNDNWAVFGQVTYNISDALSATFGLRYTDETKRFSPYSFIPEGGTYVQGPPGSPAVRYHDCPTGAEPGCGGVQGRLFTEGDRLVPAGEEEVSFDDWTPMFNIAYQVNDDVMVYFTWSEGFKSGGFDQRYNQAFPAPSSFDPEEATTYELGMKSSWRDNTLRLNASAFFTEYEDIHIIIREGFAPITFNGGEAEVKGFEIETSFVPNESWLLQASVGYIDAEYTDLSQEVIDKSPLREDFAFPQTPEWSGNIGIAYTAEMGNWVVIPRLDWSYTDEVYNDAINTPQLKSDSYDLVNASLSLTSLDEAWEIVLAGRNLGDEEYLIAGNSGYNTGASYTEAVFSRGTEWSLSVKRNF